MQDFSPIHQSLDWRLSAMFWRGSGLASFTSGEIPYVATNDGAQAGNAVATYRASLRAAEAAGTREPLSYVLELGSGSGLFAKLFLDQLADAAAADGSDDYDRTVYLVSDGSPVMLDDTRESGVLDRHEARVRRILLAAPDIRGALEDGLPGGEHPFGAIRAVHANYVLDSLPLTVLLLTGTRLGEMRLRSYLDLPPGACNRSPRTSC